MSRCYIALYYILLYYIVLYYIILYYIILYYIILYYIIVFLLNILYYCSVFYICIYKYASAQQAATLFAETGAEPTRSTRDPRARNEKSASIYIYVTKGVFTYIYDYIHL